MRAKEGGGRGRNFRPPPPPPPTKKKKQQAGRIHQGPRTPGFRGNFCQQISMPISSHGSRAAQTRGVSRSPRLEASSQAGPKMAHGFHRVWEKPPGPVLVFGVASDFDWRNDTKRGLALDFDGQSLVIWTGVAYCWAMGGQRSFPDARCAIRRPAVFRTDPTMCTRGGRRKPTS